VSSPGAPPSPVSAEQGEASSPAGDARVVDLHDHFASIFSLVSSDGRRGSAIAVGPPGFAVTALDLVSDGETVANDVTLSIGSSTAKAKVVQRLDNERIALLQVIPPIDVVSMPLDRSGRWERGSAWVMSHHKAVYDACVEGETLRGPDIRGDVVAGGAVIDEKHAFAAVVTTPPTDAQPEGRISHVSQWAPLLDFRKSIPWLTLVLSEGDRRKPELRGQTQDLIAQLEASQHKSIEWVPLQGTDVLETRSRFAKAIRDLCRSQVAVFDGGNFEPLVMLLLGIRAVVRRGVTIVTAPSEAEDEPIDAPFNIKDANFVIYGADGLSQREPWERMLIRVETGLEQISSPAYADLPAYTGVRELPPGERSKVSILDGVLLLVPFQANYRRNYQFVAGRCKSVQSRLRRDQGAEAMRNTGLRDLSSLIPPGWSRTRSMPRSGGGSSA
jgi:hypothetical protein